ncbi:alpha/beta fold hydrolase [Sphingobium boeckii]|uniref:Pimeloyl-ACP methyl ester carboxylesterase n=1 Tax=Sphingobium boeckii TaxID=1082345 RepID=A0A7W9ECZ2_9SPHN|nr:alpha/beta hydrolase [Sphingobium boeckii]MBB5684587.1 pimeloyl-ACP methyl ester carboxylesterase [Sphingobium boeckii]
MTYRNSTMPRRRLLETAVAMGAFALLPAAASAAPFASTRLSVTVQGSGPDVILIHGVDSSRAVWRSTINAVPGYRYHLVQIAGFDGVAAGGNAKGDIAKPAAEDIARYIAATRLIRPAIIGHSMGGTIALMVATRYPARIGRAMIVDMLPAPAGIVGYDAQSIRPLADGLRNMTDTPEGQRLFESVVSLFGMQSDPKRRSDSGVTARALHELALTDLTPDLPKITAPLTVVYATQTRTQTTDPAAMTRTYRTAYAGAKQAKLVPVANSGHMIMVDQPSAFQGAVRSFLAPR